jgi:hypothetical protein
MDDNLFNEIRKGAGWITIQYLQMVCNLDEVDITDVVKCLQQLQENDMLFDERKMEEDDHDSEEKPDAKYLYDEIKFVVKA